MSDGIAEVLAKFNPEEMAAEIVRLEADLTKVKHNRDAILAEKRSLQNRKSLDGPRGSTLKATVNDDGSISIPRDATAPEYQHWRAEAIKRGVRWHVLANNPPVNEQKFPLRHEDSDRIYVHSSTVKEP